jgi:hypothetical protein
MSTKDHKTDYVILVILCIIAGAIIFTLFSLGWLKEERSELPGIRTVRSTNVDGAIVCYTLFERLGFPVGRSEEMLLGDVLDEVGVLFLLEPIIPVRLGEVNDLRKWLTEGGVLISTILPKGLHPDFDKSSEGPFDYYHVPTRSVTFKRAKLTSIPDTFKNLPLARDVAEVSFKTTEIFDVNNFDSNQPTTKIKPLLTDSCGMRVGEYMLQQGRIILLSDSSFLANGLIGRRDNSVLAVNLVSYALSHSKENNVVFDEYHFGYGSHETGFTLLGQMLFTTAAGWAILSLTAAGILFLVYKGRQFGPRRGLEREHRRSKLEYIYAVGSTYRAAGANRITLEIILNWFKRKATKLTGLAKNVTNGIIAVELARHSGTDPIKYKAVLDKCDELLMQKKISKRQLTLIIGQLRQIEKEIFNGHKARK